MGTVVFVLCLVTLLFQRLVLIGIHREVVQAVALVGILPPQSCRNRLGLIELFLKGFQVAFKQGLVIGA